jgi:catechol 2,3-dioxygenase-like lactoylglutathione lyase family enzyme
MKVKRIVSNIKADDTEKAKSFYQDIFGLELAMDFGWIKTFTTGDEMPIQLSVASEGGSGTAVPNLSLEVDSIETALERVKTANVTIEYGPVIEPWGVHRFYIRDPFGNLVNVLQHV